ncbi:MAG: acetylglutamate kinase [Phycisphaeraceae bacterium]|nr:acetylglutamate kinase [Phycisphaeraceae bacterium]MCW5762665.1 acetylglutamate kinase [Phycisphaeraceae bacterium]
MSGPIVVKVGGSVLDEIASMPGLWSAIASAHAARPTGKGVIVVHGGGRAVDEQIAAMGMTTRKHEGLRITPAEQIDVVVGVLAGVVNTRMVSQLRTHGAPAVGVTLADDGVVETVRENRYSADLGLVGRVTGGSGSLLRSLLADGRLPVVASIGCEAGGALLNVNADEAAMGAAEAAGAESLVMLTDVPGVLDEHGVLIASLDVDEALSLIERGTARGGMIAKIRSAADAARHLGRPVLIGSVDAVGALIAGEANVGTRIEPSRVRV